MPPLRAVSSAAERLLGSRPFGPDGIASASGWLEGVAAGHALTDGFAFDMRSAGRRKLRRCGLRNKITALPSRIHSERRQEAGLPHPMNGMGFGPSGLPFSAIPAALPVLPRSRTNRITRVVGPRHLQILEGLRLGPYWLHRICPSRPSSSSHGRHLEMPLLRAASNAAVAAAMPPMRAASSAAERLLGCPPSCPRLRLIRPLTAGINVALARQLFYITSRHRKPGLHAGEGSDKERADSGGRRGVWTTKEGGTRSAPQTKPRYRAGPGHVLPMGEFLSVPTQKARGRSRSPTTAACRWAPVSTKTTCGWAPGSTKPIREWRWTPTKTPGIKPWAARGGGGNKERAGSGGRRGVQNTRERGTRTKTSSGLDKDDVRLGSAVDKADPRVALDPDKDAGDQAQLFPRCACDAGCGAGCCVTPAVFTVTKYIIGQRALSSVTQMSPPHADHMRKDFKVAVANVLDIFATIDPSKIVSKVNMAGNFGKKHTIRIEKKPEVLKRDMLTGALQDYAERNSAQPGTA
ncbi:hypothetical protein K438DRAFT_1782499 [Mycena galopus ATCC 62051]|nr:hypothetical protein K438DRAFT_1782499 [Mycena galopus ATCC 62051]